jgi:hypothetical protein
MNKKILILALSCTLLQILKFIFVYFKINAIWLTSFIIFFSFIAIPSAFYLAFKNIKLLPRKNNLLNLIGLLFTFPTIFLATLTYKIMFFENSHKSLEIDSKTITIFDKKRRNINIDSISIMTEKDSNNKNVIKFKIKKD